LTVTCSQFLSVGDQLVTKGQLGSFPFTIHCLDTFLSCRSQRCPAW